MASSREMIVSDDLRLEDAWNTGISIQGDIPIGNRTLSLKGDYYYTVIGDISYAEAGDIVVYYTFHFKNSGSLSGCDGIAEAYFMQDSEGKYYLYNVDIVTEVPYSID